MTIFMQNTSHKCNAQQTVHGLAWHATQTPDLTIAALSHSGLSISPASIQQVVNSLSKQQIMRIRECAQNRKLAVAYDNFDLVIPVAEPTVERPSKFWNATNATFLPLYNAQPEDLKVSALLWAKNPLNPHRKPEDIPPS